MLGLGTCRYTKGCPQSLSCWKNLDFGLGASPNNMERMFCPRAAWDENEKVVADVLSLSECLTCPLLTDHKLVRSSLSLKPLGCVQLGTNVTLWCTSGVQRAQYYFWKIWEIVI